MHIIGVVVKKSPKPYSSHWHVVANMAFPILCNRQSSILRKHSYHSKANLMLLRRYYSDGHGNNLLGSLSTTRTSCYQESLSDISCVRCANKLFFSNFRTYNANQLCGLFRFYLNRWISWICDLFKHHNHVNFYGISSFNAASIE